MPHLTCVVPTCGARISSNSKKIRKLSEPLLWAQMLETGYEYEYGAPICEDCRNKIVREYNNLAPYLLQIGEETEEPGANGDDLEPNIGENVVMSVEDQGMIAGEVNGDEMQGDRNQVEGVAEGMVEEEGMQGMAENLLAEESNREEDIFKISTSENSPKLRLNALSLIAYEYGETSDSDISMTENEEGSLKMQTESYDYDEYEENLLDPMEVETDADFCFMDSEEGFLSLDDMFDEDFLPETTFSEGGSSIIEVVSQEIEFGESGRETTASPKRRSARKAPLGSKIYVEDILSVPATQSRCFICEVKHTERNRVPEKASLDIWIKHRVLVPQERVRCCASHLKEDETFTEDAITRIVLHARKGASLTPKELGIWLNRLSDFAKPLKSLIDFDSPNLRDEDYKLLTGLYKTDFDNLLSYIEPSMRFSKHRSPRNALAQFLLLIRLGVTQLLISYLFGVPPQRVSDTIATVTKLLHRHFVPKYLGYNHLSREELQKHIPEFVRKLYGMKEGSLAILFDATYLYIEKPQDLKAQRDTYSLQKLQNLVKPMLGVLPNGYILNSEGLYKANMKNNDAGILLHMLDKENGLSNFIKEGDHFIVDRGFRDAVKAIKKRKIVVQMPELLKGQRQFSTEQANKSRKVTMTRWAIEAVNGRLKHVFRFFDRTIYNSYVFGDKLNMMWQIACAVSNAFFPPLYGDQEKHQKILEKVGERLKKRNTLKTEISRKGWDKKKNPIWEKATSENLQTFPQITEEDLFELTVGVWQTKNAILYTKQHLEEDPEYAIMTHKDEENILRAQIQSRFHKNEQHMLWIEYDNSKIGTDKIPRYYCNCKTGSRTLGTCSHVTSVVWYLGYFRHQDKQIRKKSFCSILLDAAEKTAQAQENANDSPS